MGVFSTILSNPDDLEFSVKQRLEVLSQLSDVLPKRAQKRTYNKVTTHYLQRLRDTRVKYVYTLVSTMVKHRVFNVPYLAKLLTRVDWLDGVSYLYHVVEEKAEWLRSLDLLQSLAYIPNRSVNYNVALFSPLAWHMFIAFRSPLVQNIITIEGATGAGKTTLVYSSLKAVLINLGFGLSDVWEIFEASYVQRSEELSLLLLEVSKRGLRIPLIIFDDVALTAHAYEWWSSARRDYLIKLSKALTVSREHIDCLILVGPQKKIFAGLRGISHLVFTARSKKEAVHSEPFVRTATLWFVKAGGHTIDWTGTTTPPLMVDNSVYEKITAVKNVLWKQAVEELTEMQKHKLGEAPEAGKDDSEEVEA